MSRVGLPLLKFLYHEVLAEPQRRIYLYYGTNITIQSPSNTSNSDSCIWQLLSQKYNLGFKMRVNFHFQFVWYLKPKQFDFGPLIPKPLNAVIVITTLKTNYIHTYIISITKKLISWLITPCRCATHLVPFKYRVGLRIDVIKGLDTENLEWSNPTQALKQSPICRCLI
jgi:hypothetical protein